MKRLLLLLVFLLVSLSLHAQNPEWINYNSSNSGLTSDHVSSIAIDGLGNKWIGTYPYYTGPNEVVGGGVAKFDGINWTVYNTSNSGLPNNYINSIAIDNSGNKWIGTEGGLAKFDGTNWIVYTYFDSGLPSNNIVAIAIDNAGILWIGTSGGLAKFDGTNWTTYDPSNSGYGILTISIDGSGNKWIGTYDSGLRKFDGINWTKYTSYNSKLPTDFVSSLAIDGLGNLWIGTARRSNFMNEYGGLSKFDGTNWMLYFSINSDLPSLPILVRQKI